MGTTLAGIVDPHIRSIVRESCILSSLSFSLFSLFQFMSWRFDRGHPDNKMSFIFFKQYNIYCILEYYNILFSIFKLFKLILKRVDRNCVLNLIFPIFLIYFWKIIFFQQFWLDQLESEIKEYVHQFFIVQFVREKQSEMNFKKIKIRSVKFCSIGKENDIIAAMEQATLKLSKDSFFLKKCILLLDWLPQTNIIIEYRIF